MLTSSEGDRRALLERIEEMGRDEIDALPVGIITLDLDGTILRYNQTEAGYSRRHAPAQVGRNFFRDVAPCTQDAGFQGRFEALAAPGGHGTVEFEYQFHFPWGSERVLISFMRAPDAPRIQLLITWPAEQGKAPLDASANAHRRARSRRY
ncbi:MAG: PAS domain-containing protein [Candidatus Eremiobacteraeota bacterium]|nr:PAS domain-containing protein [Candidatus Eremiobacteraeota bacterium]